MASDDVHWASVPGLRSAAIRIEAEGGRFARVFSDLYAKIGDVVVNPGTFGTDKSSRAFFTKWDSDFRNLDEGVRDAKERIVATAWGVDNVADAVDSSDKDTTDMADELDSFLKGGGTSGAGGGSHVPNIPPLTPPSTIGGGGSGSGNTGGTHGRH